MAGAHIQIQSVDSFEVGHMTHCRFIKRRLAVEGMQHNSLQQIAEGHIVVFSQPLEHFQQSLFQPHAGLDALDHAILATRPGSRRRPASTFLHVPLSLAHPHIPLSPRSLYDDSSNCYPGTLVHTYLNLSMGVPPSARPTARLFSNPPTAVGGDSGKREALDVGWI